MPENPIHVRVAEALGCKPCKEWDESSSFGKTASTERKARTWGCGCGSPWPHGSYSERDLEPYSTLRDYDTDWSATGPLIERYGITLGYTTWAGPPSNQLSVEPYWWAMWDARDGWEGLEGDQETGPTPLLAVCHLILALAEAGKLEAA